jgi:RNA polymerase sigma factor (TIGR02999 family)
MNDVTCILSAIEHGDAKASEDLLPLVYEELRRLAAAHMRREKPGQTLSPTALVHEAYIRLVGPGAVAQWDGRTHFFVAAAEAMRRILVESARRKGARKHGGGRRRVDLDGIDHPPSLTNRVPADDLLALDEALTRLALEDPAKAELVKLRYFAGLSVDEAAQTLGISRATAARYWDYARSWLFSELRGQGKDGDTSGKRPES